LVRRIETDALVAYVDRPWKLSLALFVGGSVWLAFCAVFLPPPWGRKDSDAGAVVMGLTTLLAAIVLQYQSRAFLIDAASGSLLILERRFLRSRLRREFPVSSLGVHTSVAQSTPFLGRSHRSYWIWIEPAGQRSILFAQLRDQRTLQDLVSALRSDLRRAVPISLPPLD